MVAGGTRVVGAGLPLVCGAGQRRLAALGARPRRDGGPPDRPSSENPDCGPLLIISGEKDNTVPWAIANASYKKQQRNAGVTEIGEIPGRGHALTIDNGSRQVADTALAFVERFAPSTGTDS